MSRTKYPRTPHLPWSPGVGKDDRVLTDLSRFKGKRVIVTEKLDGECTTGYRDGYTHARSTDSGPHPSRSWMKQFFSGFCFEIPDNWRLCGENLYAFHSILYRELPTYFFAFGLYDSYGTCLEWEETCFLLDYISVTTGVKIHTAPVLYDGIWDEELIKGLWTGKGTYPTFGTKAEAPKWPDDFKPCEAEGYVVRLNHSFPGDEFDRHCAKFVRKGHVQTDQHWMSKPVVPNHLKEIDLPLSPA